MRQKKCRIETDPRRSNENGKIFQTERERNDGTHRNHRRLYDFFGDGVYPRRKPRDPFAGGYERSFVLTLTKKMAEDLTDYLLGLSLKVKYIHSEVETFERVELLKGLRAGEFDVLIGINLLREGIDLPEVSFIAILDADKIGFLRSATSLIQIIGRAARNAEGTVVMYADRMSDAMQEALNETKHRRKIQEAYNKEHGITPKTIAKAVEDILVHEEKEAEETAAVELAVLKKSANLFVPSQRKKLIAALKNEMAEAADRLEYEKAAVIRDQIRDIENQYGS